MSYSKKDKYFPAGIGPTGQVGALVIVTAGTTFSWVPKDDVLIYGFGGLCTVATGTQTTTVGVCSISTGGTERATFTAGVSAAIGTEVTSTNFGPIRVPAGTTVAFAVKTACVGGTTTGQYAPYIYCEFFPATIGG